MANEVNAGFIGATGGAEGPTTPTATKGPIDPALRDALDVLATALGGLLDARGQALDELEADTEPAAIPNPVLDLALTAISIAMGAATAGIGGAVGAAASATIGDAILREVVKSAVKDAVDDSLKQSLESAVGVEWAGGGTADPRKGFFRGPKTPLLMAKTAVKADLVNPTRLGALEGDASGEVYALADQVVAMTDQAKSIQRQQSLSQWLLFLARSDLGTTMDPCGNADGTDLSGMMDSEKSVGERLFGEPTRGVLRLQVKGLRDMSVDLWSARLAGVNPEIVAELADRTPSDVGIPVFVTARFDGREPGVAELGENESGALFLEANPTGEGWLARYATGAPAATPWDAEPASPAAGDAEAGAQLLLKNEVWDRTFGELRAFHG